MRLKYILACPILLFSLICMAGCSKSSANPKDSEPPDLSKCINIGNCLEAPKDESWDVPMDISYFSIIKQAGFHAVRLPIRFSDYVDTNSSNYTLNEEFMKKIDSYIDEAISQDLTIILDFHHFLEIMEEPSKYKDCFISIWTQLATRYKDYPDTLVFELLNEPQNNLNSDIWNKLLGQAVSAIRKIDKTHYLIIGGADYNSIDGLSSLILPDDKKLIATIHYYEPYEVTFQNNIYLPEYAQYKDVVWEGTSEEIQYMKSRLTTAKNWAEQNNISLFIGEFGVNQNAPRQTRINWTRSLVKEADSLGINYSYWEFASIFGIYDLNTREWDNELLNTVLGN